MSRPWGRNRLKFALAGPLFEAGNRFIPGRPHDRLAQLVADQKPKRVLELCGGTGYAARLLARKSPSTRVDCLDISPEMLAVGRRYLTRAGIGTVALHEGDAAALPFGNDTFDVVMSVFGWHELPTDIRHRAIDEAIARNLQVLDATAFALCRDQKLPIKVFSIFKHGALKRVVMGEDEGTLVYA